MGIDDYIKRLEDSRYTPMQVYWYLIEEEKYTPKEVMAAFERLGQREEIMQGAKYGDTPVAFTLRTFREEFFTHADCLEIEHALDHEQNSSFAEEREDENERDDEPVGVTVSDDGYILNTSKPITAANNKSYEEHVSMHDNSGAPSVRNQGTGKSGEEREEREEEERTRRTFW